VVVEEPITPSITTPLPSSHVTFSVKELNFYLIEGTAPLAVSTHDLMLIIRF
jgi:hypothetical protein